MGKKISTGFVINVMVPLLIMSVLASLFYPIASARAGTGEKQRYGETISGNVVTSDDKKMGNDRWRADTSVILEEGTLWWTQYHNSFNTGGDDGSEYVYYRTVGMRFTLEDVSGGEESIPTLDMDENSKVWDKQSVKFVDVFMSGVGADIKNRTSELLTSGENAGGRRIVSSSVLVNKDTSRGENVIEGNYYIDNFLKRDTLGRIEPDCVVGKLIGLKCGGGSLPAGKWRIYASHIIETMTATVALQPGGRYSLANRKERFVKNKDGVSVPDIRTTLADAVQAANWSNATRETYLPALFNRYLELTDERLVSTTIAVNYYMHGSNPKAGIVKTTLQPVSNNTQGSYDSVALQYTPDEGSRPDSLRLRLNENAFVNGGAVYEACDGLCVYAGDRPDSFGTAGLKTLFTLSGSPDNPFVSPRDIVDDSGNPVNIVTPYMSIWVPLRPEVHVSIMYVTGDNSKPVLIRDGGTYETDGKGTVILDVPESVIKSAEAIADLSHPLRTSDGAEYEIADDAVSTAGYFYGTEGWNLEHNTQAASKYSMKSPTVTVNSLSLTGKSGDGRRFGVMGQGTGNRVSFSFDRHVTDIVMFVRVTRKKTAIETRKLYVRYVPANGRTHILKDLGPIVIPLGEDHDYVHQADPELTYSGTAYVVANDPANGERPLLGVWTAEYGLLPANYGAVTENRSGAVKTAQTESIGDGRFRIRIPAGARDAMLFIPYETKAIQKLYGAQINIYYIKSLNKEYKVLASEKLNLPEGYYEEALKNGRLSFEFPVRSEVSDSTGALWTAVDDTGSMEYPYAVIASQKPDRTVGNTNYPGALGEPGWSSVSFNRFRTEMAVIVEMALMEGARSYDVFVPCTIRTGNNPVNIYAVDASSGKLLKKDPVATSFMQGAEYLIDVSGFEEIAARGKTYVMTGESLENSGAFPHKTTAYAYAGFRTVAVPSPSLDQSHIVRPGVFLGDSSVVRSSVQMKARYVYLNIGSLEIPPGNVIAVYIPYKTASEVNVYLITDENTGLDPSECATVKASYSVSRSYWANEASMIEGDAAKAGDAYGGGWFEFEVPDEISDREGMTFYISDEDPVAIHHDACCDGVLQKVGLSAVLCPYCEGEGSVYKPGGSGEKEKCSLCDGSGIWLSAVNYRLLTRDTALQYYGTEIRHKCVKCHGTARDPTLADHAHEPKNCPECNSDGKGPRTSCPACYGNGRISYIEWESDFYFDENGGFHSTSRPVTKFRSCDFCGGSGKYTCGTCDGTGMVAGDLCRSCYRERYYLLSGQSSPVRPVYSFGTGYKVERRDICGVCGGKGYSVCRSCNGSGWSSIRDETGHILPCADCGGSSYMVEGEWVYNLGRYEQLPPHREYVKGSGEKTCGCVGGRYFEDPDLAKTDPSFSRGSKNEYYVGDTLYQYRDWEGFMCGGFYCEKCNSYIFGAGYPKGKTLVYRKDPGGKVCLTIHGVMDSECAALGETLFDTQYRSVVFDPASLEDFENHSGCGLEFMTGKETFAQARADTLHKTAVVKVVTDGTSGSVGNSVDVGSHDRDGNTGTVRMRVYVPSDIGIKATDVYILYTGWQAFSMPDPEPRIRPPDPFVRLGDVVFTDTDTDSCAITIVAGDNETYYDPSLSIPSGRNIKLKAQAREYLYDIVLTNVVGMVQIPVTVRYPYAFYNSAADYRRGEEPAASGNIEKKVVVMRPYSYWCIEKLAVWKPNRAGVFCNAYTEGDTGYERLEAFPASLTNPVFSAVRLGDTEKHLVGLQTGGEIVITVDELYADIVKNGIMPELPTLDVGYAERMAYEAVPELSALNDTLIFNGQCLLGNTPNAGPTGLSPKRGELLTFFSKDRMIPGKKKNGIYPVAASTVSYSLAPGSIGLADETKYRSTDTPAPVVVQTPVYVKGGLAMTPGTLGAEGRSFAEALASGANGVSGAHFSESMITDNILYVQQENADTGHVWAVLGEERAYEGFESAPTREFCTCDLYAVLTNKADESHPHLSYPGYGVRTFDEDIYRPQGEELPYNRISSDTGIVIDRSYKGGKISWEPDFIRNSADAVLDAGEWISVPADTVLRIIIPRDTVEGRHYIDFACVATNKEDPEDTLNTAMEIANTYRLSHAVYNRKFFSVTGRLYGLNFESTDLKKIGVGNRSAAGLVLSDPPDGYFPAGEEEGIKTGMTARFTVVSTGIRGNTAAVRETRGSGLKITPTFLFVPVDGETGALKRSEAVEAELWYDPGPYTGKAGLSRFEPEVKCRAVKADDPFFVPSDEETFEAYLFLPAGIKAAPKGSFDHMPFGIGLTSTEGRWFKGGVLVVNFDIKLTYTIADRIVTLGYNSGSADMWALEGYVTDTGNREGDVLIINPLSDIRKNYFVDHLN